MQFLTSWISSLALLMPRHLKLLVLVTLKTSLATYANVFWYGWWLIGLVILVPVYLPEISGLDLTNVLVIHNLLVHALAFVIFLLARSSVDRKGYGYLSRYAWYFPLYMVTATIFQFFALAYPVFFKLFGEALSGVALAIVAPFLLIGQLFFFSNPLTEHVFMNLAFVFFTLFWLDTDKGASSYVRSWSRAAKLLWYNLPFCVASFALFFFAFLAISSGVLGIALFIRTYAPALMPYGLYIYVPAYTYGALLPLFVCYWHTMYTKKTYERLTLYY